MLEHLYIPRQGDRELILCYLKELTEISDLELLSKVKKFTQNGFVGAHQQGLYFIALWKEANSRQLKTPFLKKNNHK